MNTVAKTVFVTYPHFRHKVLDRMFEDFPMGEALNGNVYSIQAFIHNAYKDHRRGGIVGEMTLLNNRLSYLRYKLFVCDIVDDEACGRL